MQNGHAALQYIHPCHVAWTAAWTWTRTCSMYFSMLHFHCNAAFSCPSCMSMSKSILFPRPCYKSISMLQGHVHAACPCPRCISMSMLHLHVYAASPCPCCISMSMLHLHVHVACVHRHRHRHGHEQGQGHGRMEANILKGIFWSGYLEANWSEYFIFRFALFRSEYFEVNLSELKRIFLYEYSQIKANIHRKRLGFASIRFIANNWKKRIWDTLVNILAVSAINIHSAIF
jgi:hypothetical protein